MLRFVFPALIATLPAPASSAQDTIQTAPMTTAPEPVYAPPAPYYPPPVKVECLDDVQVEMKDSFGIYWYCLYLDDDQRLGVAVVDEKERSYGSARLSISTALYLLSNPKVAALHPVILKAAGAGLEKLRSAELAQIRRSDFRSENNESSLVSLNPDAIGRLIDKAKVLKSLGYEQEAMDSVAKVLAAFEKKNLKSGKTLSTEKQWRWMSLRSSYSGMLVASGAIEEGLASYRQLATDGRIVAEYRTNAKVNLAALLAENGRFDESLRWIDEARAEYDAQADDDVDNYKLGGSNRHFAWIRACALVGLGRDKEAKPLIDLVLAAPEKPFDEFADIYSTSSIERRLYACADDVERMVAFVKASENHPLYGHFAYVYLQPELNFRLPRQNAFLKKVQVHPDLKKYADEMISLPPSVVPALNSWR